RCAATRWVQPHCLAGFDFRCAYTPTHPIQSRAAPQAPPSRTVDSSLAPWTEVRAALRDDHVRDVRAAARADFVLAARIVIDDEFLLHSPRSAERIAEAIVVQGRAAEADALA